MVFLSQSAARPPQAALTRAVRLPGLVLLAVLLLVLAGCGGSATKSPIATPGAASVPIDRNTAVTMKPQEGGIVGLSDGAELAVPRQTLSDNTLVTIRVADPAPAAAVPRSIIGRAYSISFEGGTLAGTAMLKLPLPADVAPDQYDLAIYRWDGRQWERLGGKYESQGIRVGVTVAATYAVLGQWRMATITAALSLPAADPAQPTFPVQIQGQYKFAAQPIVQHEYVEAHLLLKLDTTGGAGQVAGNEALDHTVNETVLWFRPDPGQTRGTIDYSYSFQVDPVALGVALGSVNRFYAALVINDAAAPTRILSNAADYTAMLPIKVVGSDVVRPDVAGSQALQWHVRLNGKTLFRRPATTSSLSLAEALAQGGLGEYKITLELQRGEQFLPVSNEVMVQLALPGTATPTPAPHTPGNGAQSPWPFGTMPPTPTRRTPPGNYTPGPIDSGVNGGSVDATPLPSATITPTITPTPSPTQPSWARNFWADTYTVAPGGCTTLHWDVEGVQAVYLDGVGTASPGEKLECPANSTTYKLHLVRQDSSEDRYLTVVVQSSPAINYSFTANHYQLAQNECTVLSWRAENVKTVKLDGQGVSGVAEVSRCPKTTTEYRLEVDNGTEVTTLPLTVYVLPEGQVPISFWAEQYTLPDGACTTIHWSVDGVQAVYLSAQAAERGVGGSGTQKVCPKGTETYSLRVKVDDDHSNTVKMIVSTQDPGLGSSDLLAIGMVTSVEEVTDLQDSSLPGQVPGYKITISGVEPLFKGYSNCCSRTMQLKIMKSLIASAPASRETLDWPIRPGQLIEFRAGPCDRNVCNLITTPTRPFYIKLRSD